MSQPGEDPLNACDVFVAVYLPYVVETHFLAVALLLEAERHATGPAADVVKAEIAPMPLRGAEIVSAVFELEEILRAARKEPPPPPRLLPELAPWREALYDAIKPYCAPREATPAAIHVGLRANGALYAARALGDAEQTLRLQVLVDKVRALVPDEPWIEAQHTNLEKARVGVLTHFRDLVGEGVKLALPLGPIAVDAITEAMKAVEAASDPRSRSNAREAVGRHARTVEACMLLPRARELLASRKDWRAALRPMLQMPGWSLPCELTGDPPAPAPLAFSDGDEKVMRVFTDDDALKASGFAGTCLRTRAWAALGQVDARFDEVVIDAGAPHETRIAKAELGPLQHLCFSGRVESVVRDFGGMDLAALRAFEEYRVLFGERGVEHVPAADRAGRQHAAVFTSDDAIAAHLARAPADPGVKIGWLSGAKLFPLLAAANAPGVVFNPAGPTRPRWFTRPFLERLARE